MARVTRESGHIVIVSHLNAGEGGEGMEWVEDVLIKGLEIEHQRWSIKCHIDGRDLDVEEEEEEEEGRKRGPAVYVIRKLRQTNRRKGNETVLFEFVEH